MRYFKILRGEEKPKFIKNRKKYRDEYFEECELCEWKCGVNRFKEKGVCGVGTKLLVASIFPHYGEESILVPSLTVFFCGCNFRCIYCQNWDISQDFSWCKEYNPQGLAEAVEKYAPLCKNINFVGGEPTMYAPLIGNTLYYVKSPLPVVWNSNFYFSETCFELIKQFTDLYLSDWKYGNDECARRLSGVNKYWEVVSRNHDLAFEDADLLIRHLVLPNHFDCCTKPILDYIANNYGEKVLVNVMGQYRPEWRAYEAPEINRTPTYEEIKKARGYAKDLGLILV